MKVLRIYDHQGILRKEFNLYVEGSDFKWEASYPEPVWLGTIILEDAGKEPEKPSEFVSVPLQPEPEVDEAYEAAVADLQPEFYGSETEVTKEEVKDEPKKVHGKRSRVKRSASPASPESTEGLPQKYSPGDNHKRNKRHNLG